VDVNCVSSFKNILQSTSCHIRVMSVHGSVVNLLSVAVHAADRDDEEAVSRDTRM